MDTESRAHMQGYFCYCAPMVREISSGGVVVRQISGEWMIAAIEPQREENSKPSGSRRVQLALPKGLVDPGERPEQTALREVHEETGLIASVISKLTDIKYVYVRSWGDGERVFKVVSFFLFLYRGGKLGDISEEMRVEVRDAVWLPLEEAPKRLAYRGERDVAKLAHKYVAAHPELWESKK